MSNTMSINSLKHFEKGLEILSTRPLAPSIIVTDSGDRADLEQVKERVINRILAQVKKEIDIDVRTDETGAVVTGRLCTFKDWELEHYNAYALRALFVVTGNEPLLEALSPSWRLPPMDFGRRFYNGV